MQPNGILQQDNMVMLKPGLAFKLNLGKLPKSRYFYRFFIHNPSGIPGQLKIAATGKNWKTAEQVLSFTGLVAEYRYNFDTTDSFDYCYIHFLLEKKEPVFLQLPVSPGIVQEIDMQPPFLFGLDESILARIDELESTGWQRHPGRKGALPISAQKGTMNSKEVEAFVNARYFKGFLSLEESERQLDYIIFHKVFNLDGAKGFVKYKKKFYKGILIGTYRLLIRNRSRKLYLAKIYRNYVNTGILAENSQN